MKPLFNEVKFKLFDGEIATIAKNSNGDWWFSTNQKVSSTPYKRFKECFKHLVHYESRKKFDANYVNEEV